MSCLSASTVASLFANRLSPHEQQRVHVHADACGACRGLLVEVARGRSTARDEPDAASSDSVTVADAVAASVADTDVHAPHVVLAAGDRVARYVIERFIGAGAMGAVYEARDPELGRRVALKIVAAAARAGTAAEARAVRLVREAQAMARLTHPNIVQVFDAGRSDDVMFIAMQLVEGASLRTHLATTTTSTAKRLAIMRDVARGLAHAHDAGIIHRDLKPDNILIDRAGTALVGDFGLARLPEERAEVGGDLAGGDAWETMDGAILGTPAYMAPEVARGERADARSDQYSFGVTLAEVLAADGRPDRERASRPQAVRRPPRRIRRAIRRACAAEPAARFPSMTALGDALAPRVTPARAAVGVAALGTLAALLAWPRGEADPADACQRAADAKLARAWRGTPRATAEAHLASLRVPGAAPTTRAVLGGVDEYADAWRAMRRDACEATRVRGEQTATLYDLRMTCLDDRLGELAVVGRALATLPAAELPTALGLRDLLGDLTQCADARSLERRAPRDPATLARARALGAELTEANATIVRRRVAEVTGIEVAGLAEALATAERVLATARAERLLEIEARALRVRAYLKGDGAGTDQDSFYRALAIGDRLGDPAIRADALLGLLSGATEDAKRAGEVPMLVRLVETALADLPGPQHERRAHLLDRMAVHARDRGELAKAEQGFREALVHLEAAHGRGAPRALQGRRLLARVLLQQKRLDDMRALLRETISVIRETYGDPHPLIVAVLLEMGRAFAQAGVYAEARAALTEALAMAEALHGPLHLQVVMVLTSLGFLGLEDDPADARRVFERAATIVALAPGRPRELAALLVGRGQAELATGDPRAAVASLERGFAVWAAHGSDRNLAPTARFALAKALWETGGDRRRARALATEALEAYRTTKGPWTATVDEVTREVERWLRAHR